MYIDPATYAGKSAWELFIRRFFVRCFGPSIGCLSDHISTLQTWINFTTECSYV